MINTKLVYNSFIIITMAVLALLIYPDLDLSISELFFRKNHGFIFAHNFVVQILFLAIPVITALFCTLCSVIFIYLLVAKSSYALLRNKILYLILAMIIGPGFVVNYIFKENFGRARPCQIMEFESTKRFSPAFVITDQCEHNCSFSSGHAAMGVYFTAIAYYAPSYRNNKRFTTLYLLGIFFGVVVGGIRILMGGHFLSDVLVSFLVVISVNHILYLFFQRRKWVK